MTTLQVCIVQHRHDLRWFYLDGQFWGLCRYCAQGAWAADWRSHLGQRAPA